MASNIIHSTNPYLLNIGGTFGCIPLLFGIAATFNPEIGYSIFSFDKPKTPEAQKLGRNLWLIWASRDLFVGAASVAAMLYKDPKVMGAICLGSALFVTSFDAVVSYRQTGTGIWAHLPFVPVGLGLGAALLGAFD